MHMLQTQAAPAKVITDLTCWKCGEETLKQVVDTVDANAFRRDTAVASALMQSTCGKCGALSVNATQSRHNKTVGRKTRKAIIKEANRKSA
jgi:hypothetical protein